MSDTYIPKIGDPYPVKAEMRPAYEWTCEECGRNQFESAIVAEFSDEDRLETAREAGLIDEFATEIPEDLTGEFMSYPDEVTCSHCGTIFETLHMSQEEDGLP